MSASYKIFPESAVVEAIPDATMTTLGVKEITRIVGLKGLAMFELGLTTWHVAMMSGQFRVAPNSLGELVDRREPTS